ncbi:hypothetical protein HJC23_009475 [Cyclotella cryptica]|uniref:Pentacotripeptide-repeat region of PRORP domain-containing protein n=1 Tax=Cyclotella cryptica TaxID=29204 RepID=A0ABD3PAM9_9STRA|eukprot:CCRYP_017281-RA/>CCRYP_017281-RA protein AED:0.01 eAED:0.01 QI:515/1/1/1/1/1/2/402/1095
MKTNTNQRTRLASFVVPFCVHTLLSSHRGSSAWMMPYRSSGMKIASYDWPAGSIRSSPSSNALEPNAECARNNKFIATSHVRSRLYSTPPSSSTHHAELSGIHSNSHQHPNPESTTAKQRISFHLAKASQALSKNDIATQHSEVELAEQELLLWVEHYRHRSSDTGTGASEHDIAVERPEPQVFNDVIWALLALPSSYSAAVESWKDDNLNRQDPSLSFLEANDSNGAEDASKGMDQLRAVLGKSKLRNIHRKGSGSGANVLIESKSERATRILDLMESLHEPLGSVYDDIIASHSIDALECLSRPQQKQQNEEDSHHYYNQAWKSAKLALSLLTRSEELYRETGEDPSRLPSISSYVAVMDVWKALAVSAEERLEEKKREEALDVVRMLNQRRLEIYSLENMNDESRANYKQRARFNLLPVEKTGSVKDVLQFAISLLHQTDPSYEPPAIDESIGTWHFNHVIFDLAKYPQPFSGALAQDLLEFMVCMVKESSPKVLVKTKTRRKKPSLDTTTEQCESNPIIPKPNTDTINGVLKAWMVTPDITDAARRAEAILAQIAVWQSDGTLWGVHPDVVSYNTCMSCWKDSGIPGGAARATEILTLLEANITDIQPDVISYATCIGAWAESSARDGGSGRRAEEILTRMYQRSKNDSSLPRPNTRCFNAVLLAYANSRQEGGGKRALELLRFMERLHSEGYEDVRPDSYTLNIVMKALTNCGENGAAQKASQILKRMEESFSMGDTRLKPDLLSYNIVLDAFAKKGDALAAEALLNQMYERVSKSGGIAKPPNAHSYTAVLSAWARCDDKVMAVKRAEELFNDLERKYAAGETDVRADTSVYNALINCWAKSGDRQSPYRVTKILDLMEELGLQGGDCDVQPNSRTYCAVLDALAKSRNWKAYSESLAILDRMEELYAEGFESVRPCARAYSIVISTIARSRKKGKAVKAQEILHRMESEYRKGNIQARPTVYSYNAVINAAAYTPKGDEREQEEAFKVACLTFDQLIMSDYLKPSHVSYGTFLKAIQNLMPVSDVRDDLVKSVFRRCCRDGQVGTLVLRSMKQLASPELYQSLLEGESKYDLPKSWSANIRERTTVMI